jgi:hypothetical protein
VITTNLGIVKNSGFGMTKEKKEKWGKRKNFVLRAFWSGIAQFLGLVIDLFAIEPIVALSGLYDL